MLTPYRVGSLTAFAALPPEQQRAIVEVLQSECCSLSATVRVLQSEW